MEHNLQSGGVGGRACHHLTVVLKSLHVVGIKLAPREEDDYHCERSHLEEGERRGIVDLFLDKNHQGNKYDTLAEILRLTRQKTDEHDEDGYVAVHGGMFRKEIIDHTATDGNLSQRSRLYRTAGRSTCRSKGVYQRGIEQEGKQIRAIGGKHDIAQQFALEERKPRGHHPRKVEHGIGAQLLHEVEHYAARSGDTQQERIAQIEHHYPYVNHDFPCTLLTLYQIPVAHHGISQQQHRKDFVAPVEIDSIGKSYTYRKVDYPEPGVKFCDSSHRLLFVSLWVANIQCFSETAKYQRAFPSKKVSHITLPSNRILVK